MQLKSLPIYFPYLSNNLVSNQRDPQALPDLNHRSRSLHLLSFCIHRAFPNEMVLASHSYIPVTALWVLMSKGQFTMES